jgi:hypothetical protein
MIEERRANPAAQRVRVANQLHAVLRDLIPGGGPLAITANSAWTLLRSVRPESPAERTRKELAQDLVRELCAADASLGDIETRMTAALDDHGFADTSTERFGRVFDDQKAESIAKAEPRFHVRWDTENLHDLDDPGSGLPSLPSLVTYSRHCSVSMFHVERSLSTSRGVAPVYRIALTDAMNVNLDTGTTVSGAAPVAIRATWRAAVLLA